LPLILQDKQKYIARLEMTGMGDQQAKRKLREPIRPAAARRNGEVFG